MVKMALFRYIIVVFGVLLISCSSNREQKKEHKTMTFSSDELIIKGNNSYKQVKGQVLYLPVYSNIPYHQNNRLYDVSAFVAIHNTDFDKTMKITKILYFDNDGMLVSNYLKNDTILQPLAAVNFLVPEADQSGTGANFIVEWVSDSLINEPLIETVMIGLTHGQGVSFLSTGKVLREVKE